MFSVTPQALCLIGKWTKYDDRHGSCPCDACWYNIYDNLRHGPCIYPVCIPAGDAFVHPSNISGQRRIIRTEMSPNMNVTTNNRGATAKNEGGLTEAEELIFKELSAS